MSINILRLPDVLKRTGLSRTSLYVQMKLGRFPQPIELGVRCRGWVEDDIQDWLLKQIEMTRAKEAARA